MAAHPRWSLRRLEIDGSIAREPSSELDDAGINKTVFKKRYDRKPKAIAEGVEPEQ